MNSKTLVITGCSSGIGMESALGLKKRGHHVIASCRKKTDKEKLESLGLETVLLDLNDSNSIKQGFAEIMLKANGRIDVLINNAGYGQVGALEDISRELLRKQFETNVFGLLELTNYIIPLMRKQQSGRIINISSILGVVSMPFRGAYNASKYALEGLSDTLRMELSSANIQVITIEPGPINSQFRVSCAKNFLPDGNLNQSYFAADYQHMLDSYHDDTHQSRFTKNPEAVLKVLIHAIESAKPRVKYPVTFPAHVLIFLKRILSYKLMDRILRKASQN